MKMLLCYVVELKKKKKLKTEKTSYSFRNTDLFFESQQD